MQSVSAGFSPHSCLLGPLSLIPFAWDQEEAGHIIQDMKLVGKKVWLASWRLMGVDEEGIYNSEAVP